MDARTQRVVNDLRAQCMAQAGTVTSLSGRLTGAAFDVAKALKALKQDLTRDLLEYSALSRASASEKEEARAIIEASIRECTLAIRPLFTLHSHVRCPACDSEGVQTAVASSDAFCPDCGATLIEAATTRSTPGAAAAARTQSPASAPEPAGAAAVRAEASGTPREASRTDLPEVPAAGAAAAGRTASPLVPPPPVAATPAVRVDTRSQSMSAPASTPAAGGGDAAVSMSVTAIKARLRELGVSAGIIASVSEKHELITLLSKAEAALGDGRSPTPAAASQPAAAAPTPPVTTPRAPSPAPVATMPVPPDVPSAAASVPTPPDVPESSFDTASPAAAPAASTPLDAAATARERVANLNAAEAAAAAERDELERIRPSIDGCVAAWAATAGWSGPKAMRKEMKLVAAMPGREDEAREMPSRALAVLLATVHEVESLRELCDRPLFDLKAEEMNDMKMGNMAAPTTGKLKKAYMAAVRAFHPDKTGGCELLTRATAEAVFTVITSAWDLHNASQPSATAAS